MKRDPVNAERDHVIAVDIGTGSARAGVFDGAGALLARADHPIAMHRPAEGRAEQDSEDIWRAACTAVRAARMAARVGADRIGAIGFDATCSLVVRDCEGQPLCISEAQGEEEAAGPRWDTIVWLDHRAAEEAEACTATGHPVMVASGTVMSPEMQMPKLMWLKRHLPARWARAGLIFDLADFMTWRATGSAARSRCTLAAKWHYGPAAGSGWDRDFLAAIGLEDLEERCGLSAGVLPVGASIGSLTPEAAADLGLDPETRVAAGLIDAYAGALGVLGGQAGDVGALGRQMALIGGTSACLVAFSATARPARGLWGPYHEAVFPGLFLIEGGQSAAGGLLDHIVRSHGGGMLPDAAGHRRIIDRIRALRDAEGAAFAVRLHVLPDFHGNRSPHATPDALGVISGLPLDSSFDALCRLYWRTLVSLALGIRQILDLMAKAGYPAETLHVTGGQVRNSLLVELYADVTGCRVVVPRTPDAVLLGTAMGASVAAGLHPDLQAAGVAMQPEGETILPSPERAAHYERDYAAFLLLQRQRAELEALISA
ncbi:FGGY-family pentulose kinase [Rhizobium sp. RU20A]|uniref:FGGY-family carbohydrate kinase n=1 Tax=Rhizobium sp. RU20A TaxID=1907412 RepID=UPI000956FC89|nr:FGGY-family carbohydrate kinase [Rhizobium sp. RU20A]SIQ31217.1 FGGY-family pentulose kinase [Rhizobium sp. RU20A]